MIAFYLTNMVSGGSAASAGTSQVYAQPSMAISIAIRMCFIIGVFIYPLYHEDNYSKRAIIAIGEKWQLDR